MNYDCRNRFYRGGTSGGLIRRGLLLLLGFSLAQGALVAHALTDEELRASAPSALDLNDVPDMSHIKDKYVKSEDWAIKLGKALFWDMQVGGDGVQACASCHFVSGADPRSINQLNPGRHPTGTEFEPKNGTGAGVPAGPNYQLQLGDFPFYEVSPGTGCTVPVDSGDPSLALCKGGKFDDDVVSSAGVFLRTFDGFTNPHDPAGDCSSADDSVFNKDLRNTRRVEPRNTPMVINAVFNHRNFWDGRANNFFNGVNPLGLRGQLKSPADAGLADFDALADALNTCLAGTGNAFDSSDDLCGLRDPAKAVWKYESYQLKARWPMEEHSSLASQAVGPPGSIFEMSCGDNRGFADIGRHLLYRKALALQEVHADDPVLGSRKASSGPGLRDSYSSLVRRAFKREWWSKTRGNVPNSEFKQIEANFSLFFGIAVQMYEATLVANQTPFDDFANGDDDAMGPEEKEGLKVLLSSNAKCAGCHSGPEFTGASVRERRIHNPENPDLSNPGGQPTERMFMGDGGKAVYDGGFYNIGVRATDEDLCAGGVEGGFPISFSRQASSGLKIDPESRVDATGSEVELWGPVYSGERVAVNGACKTPTLRLTALTAPYFHSGQSATLLGVVDHYAEQFRELFSVENFGDLDPDILDACVDGDDLSPEEAEGLPQHPCELDENDDIAEGQTRVHEGIRINEDEVHALVKFMVRSLTDERVVNESDVFSHPSLCVPNGHIEDINSVMEGSDDPDFWAFEGKDDWLCIPATGEDGLADPSSAPRFLNHNQDL